MQQELTEVYFYVKGTLKYKRIAIVLALLVCVAGWAFVFLMPDKFESKAKVHIDSSTVIRPLMRGMVIDPDISSLIRIIQQLMFTRPNLEKIIQLSELKPEAINGLISNDYLEEFKKDITISAARDRDIFDIGYASTNPEVAQSVVQAVLTVFSEQAQGKALADASDAQRFIEQQIRDYEIRLQEAEKAKEDFKRANIDYLSGEADQFQMLNQLKEQLNVALQNLQQAEARRNVIAEQLKTIQESDEDWGVTNLSESASVEDSRIAELKNKKTDLLIKYTDNHPDIVAIDRLIESLEQEKLQSSKSENGEFDLIGPQKMSNPYVQTLKISHDNASADVASSQALVDSIKNRIGRLQQGLNERLAIETEMKNLNRDYETINSQYSELLERRERAHITEQVDDQASRLKFKIADPPTKPTKPSAPNRKLFYSVVLAGGIVAGFGIAFLMYFIRPVFMSARQVRVVTGLPTLGSISLTNEAESKARKIDWILWSTMTFITVGYAGIMIYEFFK